MRLVDDEGNTLRLALCWVLVLRSKYENGIWHSAIEHQQKV